MTGSPGLTQAELFAGHPWCARLWPSKAALDVHLHRLFQRGAGSGNWARYSLADLRIAVTFRLLQRVGIRLVHPERYDFKLRLAVDAATWADRKITIAFDEALIVLDVPVLIWNELVRSDAGEVAA